jgi:ABC-type uncharacterized transport system ATPase subunit
MERAAPMADAPLMSANDITVRFGGLTAVAGVSLSISPGEICCIVGPNGAGKSTFFNVMTGAIRPTAGRILIGGEDFTGRPMHAFARRGVFRKFQVPSVFQSLSVLDNLRVGQRHNGDDRALTELLDLLGLAPSAGRPAGILAHGQKQWLEIGMALAARPRLLLLDEPTAGMGPEETQRTVRLIKEIADRTAVAVIEHDMEFVRALAVRTMVLHQGRVIAEGSFEQVAADDYVRDIYLGRK